MESQDYTVGRVQALTRLGLGKLASTASVGAKGSQLLTAVKGKLPTTRLGRALTLGAAVGTGMSAYKLNKDTPGGTPMEAPLITQ